MVNAQVPSNELQADPIDAHLQGSLAHGFRISLAFRFWRVFFATVITAVPVATCLGFTRFVDV